MLPPSTLTWESRRANDSYGSTLAAHPGQSQGRPSNKHGLEAHRTACATCACSRMPPRTVHRTHRRGGQGSREAFIRDNCERFDYDCVVLAYTRPRHNGPPQPEWRNPIHAPCASPGLIARLRPCTMKGRGSASGSRQTEEIHLQRLTARQRTNIAEPISGPEGSSSSWPCRSVHCCNACPLVPGEGG
jgi:hypothetical protein